VCGFLERYCVTPKGHRRPEAAEGSAVAARARLTKEHKHSRRHIDIAVAALMAHDRARDRATQRRAAIYVPD
jgi:hypothetical protein